MNATASETSIATGTLNGIGRMYGPIMPRTKKSGRKDTITASVARITGGRTSSTARSVAWRGASLPSDRWRWMFSTSTIGSSTSRPSDRISAKSVTRLIE